MIDNKILNQAELLGFDWVHMNHLTWHMILIGFGYVKSNLGLIFQDGSGIQYITKYNGGVYVDGHSKKYEELRKLSPEYLLKEYNKINESLLNSIYFFNGIFKFFTTF